MTDHLKLCIFGDQTCDLVPRWKEVFQLRENPTVEDFLTKSYHAVRNEIWKLPVDARNGIPRFATINDLILANQAGSRRCLAIDTAVSCIYELAIFIGQADAWYHGGGQLVTLGLCLGGLPSAAVCCSSNTLDLIPRAVEAVKGAFRIGLQTSETIRRLVPRNSHAEFEGSWAVLCSSAAAATDALNKYCERTGLPLTARPYISAYSSNNITISGFPSSLAQMAESEEFKGIKCKELPVHGALHAAHLYTKSEIDDIVEGLGLECGLERPKHLAFISSSGAMIQGPNFASLLRAAVDAIMTQPMDFPALLDLLHTHIQTASPASFEMIPIATTVDRVIYNTFKSTPLASLLPRPAPAIAQHKSNFPDVPPSNPQVPKLAIIGMSGRFPGGANSLEQFWDILYQGLDVHKSVPPRRWDVNTHIDLTLKKKNTGGVPWGCWIDDAGLFDARFFNISPREAPQIDPAQRLALMTVYEAIEQCGLVVDATPSTRPDRVGVFYGVTANDWAETNSTQGIDTYLIPGGNRAFIPGRINYFYKFSGPSYAVDTACSSALAAIHIACNSIWRGDIDTAIAGGTNIMSNPDPHAGLDRGHFLSRTGNCKTFDDEADGYCRGEGVGTLVIKRLDDAIADKDPILGVILDTSTNHSSESESITRPHAGAQQAIFQKLLNQGTVDPFSISYIEMHGTGTQVGDATEMSSVLSTLAPPLSEGARRRLNVESLHLGSAKANIGHGEASSGSSALIKVLLMMQKNTIVPHCGIKTRINRKFPTDLADRNVHIALQPTQWERSSDPTKPRRAIVNNFGAAGGNTAILIEDAPIRPVSTEIDPRSTHLVAVSAKSGTSMRGNLQSLLGYLKEHSNVALGELSYTTTARRKHHSHRVMLSGSNVEELCTQIDTALTNGAGSTRPKSAPKFIFTFTGQGAQYPGMGRVLLTHMRSFRKEMQRLDQIGQSLGFPSILPVIEADEDRDMNTFPPVTVQLANTCLQIALGKLWESWDIVPIAVVGHSLGEYAALNYAGVLSDADTIYLVGKRAELLQSKCTQGTHAMLVVRGSVPEITAALGDAKDTIEFACINSPVETVLAGTNKAISEATTILNAAGRKTTLLSVPYAFHSSQLDPMLPDLREVAKSVTFRKPTLPILCPLNGKIVKDDGVFDVDYLVAHSRQPVNMIDALITARDAKLFGDTTMTIEIGPHPAMGGMVRPNLGTHIPTLASLQRGRSTWSVLATTLKQIYNAGGDIRWAGYHDDFTASHNVLSLPTYSWDLKDFWITYTNDWSLRKGDPPLVINGGAPRVESTTIHKIVEEVESDDELHMIVESDITRADLSPLVRGHEVDGIPLCTPSVYADIALRLGTYLIQRYRPGQANDAVDVTDMTILKPLIPRPDATQQLMQAHCKVDWSSDSAVIRFMSFDNKQKLQEHSWCRVVFRDRSLQQTLQKTLPDLKQKFQRLRSGVVSGSVSRYTGAMCYRAIRPLARFHPDYRAAGEVLLDSNTLEASSRLSFASVKRDGIYHTHPGVIDALTQSCGFAMNCNDYADLDGDVYMNHGWSSMQLFEPISFDEQYTTYTQMSEGEDNLWYGDVVVLNSKDEVAGYIGHVAIQRVERRVLAVILSIHNGTASRAQKQLPTQQPKTPAFQPPVQAKETPRAPAITRPQPTIPAPKQLLASSTESPSMGFDKVLAIIAEESQLAVADLNDSTAFADIGIDSLLALTISSRFKEELERPIDFQALLFECPTVGELKAFLKGDSDTDSSLSGATPSVRSSSPPSESSASSVKSLDVDHPTSLSDDLMHSQKTASTDKLDFTRVLNIISEESGVAFQDLTTATAFADAGIDSLLSLVIADRLKGELGLDLPHESVLLEYPTVGELRTALVGGGPVEDCSKPSAVGASLKQSEANDMSTHPPNLTPELEARQQAVDQLVAKYSAGYSGPAPSSALVSAPKEDEKVVLITGATGSLGSHLVWHLAQLPDVKTIICINRPRRDEPYHRQYKAMSDKGIDFPESLKHKMVVRQTDTSKPTLGLGRVDYQKLVNTVTHLIHQAWPMSGKRALHGFESQFQVMRNLVDLASEVASRRPPSFKFNFQMVSSIGVVGLYGKQDGSPMNRTHVPEGRYGIDCILPNGYGDAKWGCERMIEDTLHKHPDRFRPMVVRLGQIAGSSTSGYWNPMEHFGFLVKSSQTIDALPDVPGGELHWTPVNDVASTLADLVLSTSSTYRYYHLENPAPQPCHEVNAILADAVGIKHVIPFHDWVERVRTAPQGNNPVATLLEFLDDNYLRMNYGGLVLDPKNSLEHSQSLRNVGPVSEATIRKYCGYWKKVGFLS